MIDKKWLEEIEYRLEKHPEDYYSPSVVKKLIDAYRNKNHEPIADYDILAYDTVEITKDDFYWIIGKVYEEALPKRKGFPLYSNRENSLRFF